MIYVNPVVRASNRDGYVIASFVCDDVSELPAINYLGSDKLLDMGCTAHVIGMGDYEMKSTGVWVLREPTVRVFDAYTKSEVDGFVSGLNTRIDDVEDEQSNQLDYIRRLVDEGAKNIADMTLSSFTTVTKDGVTVSLSDDTITTSGNSGTNVNSFYNVFYNGNSALLPEGDWVASLYGTGIENFRIEVYDNITGDVVKGQFGVPFHFSIPSGVIQSFLRITQKPSATCTGSFKLMICRIEDWNISENFVPYTPTLHELYEMIRGYHP